MSPKTTINTINIRVFGTIEVTAIKNATNSKNDKALVLLNVYKLPVNINKWGSFSINLDNKYSWFRIIEFSLLVNSCKENVFKCYKKDPSFLGNTSISLYFV